MTQVPQPDFQKNTPGSQEDTQERRKSANPVNLVEDPQYAELLSLFQEADFEQCQQLLAHLEGQYPGHPLLLKFKDELELKLSVTNLSTSIKQDEIHQRRRATFKLAIFAIIGTVLVLAAFFLSLYYFIGLGAVELLEVPTPTESGMFQLDQLYNQAESLLRIGSPRPAVEIIETIRSFDADYPNLEDLSARAQALLALEAQYQQGLALVEQGEDLQALAIFREVQATAPGMWDVSQQIASIEAKLQIEAYFQEAQAAFAAGNWAAVINAYEGAQSLGARLDDPQVKEQLVNAYLNQIVVMLAGDNTPVEDIVLAESYYRKAMAIIPQSRAFSTERVKLQEVVGSLLEAKFTQIAKSLLADNNQTVGSVAQAVAYLRRAANINPRSTSLQQDLQNAVYYQVGLRNFINQNWMSVINNLEPVMETDPDFAGGKASYLLFETYYIVSRQYYAAGLYQDALKYLELAEFLLWRDLDNLPKLLQLQTLYGDTLGRMGNYENAITYYQYALNAIDARTRLSDSPELLQKLDDAEFEASIENYEAAFTAFQEVLQGIEVVYSFEEIEIGIGNILAIFAHVNQSTLDLVLRANNLPRDTVIRLERTLQVPQIAN